MTAFCNTISKNIIHAGFVDDIGIYFTGSDIFINPINDGGGIKTKLVEALGFNLSAVSTINGAIGIPPGIAQNKMIIPSPELAVICKLLSLSVSTKENTMAAFYNHFYWGNIAKKAFSILQDM